MNQTEVAKIMRIILSQYRGHYKTQEDIQLAVGVMEKLFMDWEYSLIEKGLFRFMQSDSKGFPPVAGQLITLAAEIRREEYDKQKRELDMLPEPEIKREPMPDDIREKMQSLFKCPI